MLNREQLLTMLDMQGEMNAKVNPQWLDAGYPFLRAVVIEGAEAIEHAGYKWWKAQTRDHQQLAMELVDIWHFALSAEIVLKSGDKALAADSMLAEYAASTQHVVFDSNTYRFSEMDLIRKLEILIGMASVRRFSISLFESILIECGMDWADLYRQYVGKNVLNFYRQDMGYQTGTYLKIWEGREDNEHLVEILAASDVTAPDFKEQIYARLAARYQQALLSIVNLA